MTTLSEPITVTIKSHSVKNKSYTVVFPTNEQPYCQCKGYLYRRTCSHIKQAADQLLGQIIKEQLAIPPHTRPSVCLTCAAPLSGTHAYLSKCAACYRAQTFSRAS